MDLAEAAHELIHRRSDVVVRRRARFYLSIIIILYKDQRFIVLVSKCHTKPPLCFYPVTIHSLTEFCCVITVRLTMYSQNSLTFWKINKVDEIFIRMCVLIIYFLLTSLSSQPAAPTVFARRLRPRTRPKVGALTFHPLARHLIRTHTTLFFPSVMWCALPRLRATILSLRHHAAPSLPFSQNRQ